MDGGKFAFIGIGGCGMNLLRSCLKHLPDDACGIAINRDGEWLSKTDNALQKIFLAEVSGLDEQGELLPASREEVHASMQQHMAELTNKLQGRDCVVLLAGLGGFTGTWATEVVLEQLQGMGKQVIAMLILPFEFERKRLLMARESLPLLPTCDYQLVCPNQDLIQHLPAHTPMLDAFDAMGEQLCKALHQIEEKALSKGAYRMRMQADGFELLPDGDMEAI